MPIPRLFFSVAAADGEVYTIGGMLAEPVDFVNAYDPNGQMGSESESTSSTRGYFASMVKFTPLADGAGNTSTRNG